jgi:hypothetical protein
MAVQNAVIKILDKDAIDPKRGLTELIRVQFNPAEYNRTKAAQLAEIGIPGLDSPILQFIRGQTETLKLDLFFDTTAGGMGDGASDVRELTKGFYQLVKIQPKTHAPPRIQLSWGEGLSFKAIVDSVDQKFTLFSPAGIPLRATVTLSLREYKTLEEQLAELNLQTSDHTKLHAVLEDETLASIALAEYGDARLWRRIADANSELIDDPAGPPVGAQLEIPSDESRTGVR